MSSPPHSPATREVAQPELYCADCRFQISPKDDFTVSKNGNAYHNECLRKPSPPIKKIKQWWTTNLSSF